MNKKYSDLNLQLIRKMDENQRIAFVKFASRPNSKYLILFEIYSKIDFESINGINPLQEYERVTGNTANNDLNENLHKKLCEFIHEEFKETEDPYFEEKKNLEIARSLIGTRKYNSAIFFLEKSFKGLSKIVTFYDNHHLFIQWLDLTSRLVQEFPTDETLNLQSRELPNSELFQWMSRIAGNAVNNIKYPDDYFNVKVGNNLFMGLLRDYLIAKGEYNLLLKHVSITSANYGFRADEFQVNSSKWMNRVLEKNRILLLLEGIYTVIKLNDWNKFSTLIQELDSIFNNLKGINYALFLFMKLHLIDLEMRMKLLPRDLGHEELIANLIASDYNLIGPSEVANFALRVELNQGIIFILNQDYSSAFEIFSREIPFPKADETIKYYWKLFCLVAYLRVKAAQSSVKDMERWLSELKKMKAGKSVFSVRFILIIDKNRSTPAIFRELPQFLEANKPMNLFDKVLSKCCKI